jgi:hypothetical protein
LKALLCRDEMSDLIGLAERLRFHEPECDCGYLNPVTEWAGGSNLIIVAYECPKCKKRVPASALKREHTNKGFPQT